MFTPVEVPRITSIAQDALVAWSKKRKEYEEKIVSRCKTTGEELQRVLISVKNSFDVEILESACFLEWNLDMEQVTDDQLREKITEIMESVKNETLPDINALFKQHLRMDMSESDIKQRILKFFKDCNRLVEDHGLQGCFEGSDGKKEKCKLLQESLYPLELKERVKQAIRFQQKEAKSDIKKLYDLVKEKALELEKEAIILKQHKKPNNRKRPNSEAPDASQAKKFHKSAESRKTTGERIVTIVQNRSTTRKPPTRGCLVCKGPHWLKDCPNATEEEKEKARASFLAKRKGEGRHR